MNGKLYIVATPIGNLSDITLRALETLKKVDVIACEDTRVTAKLLARYEFKKPLFSIHEKSKPKKVIDFLVDNKGAEIAFVSDAGSPGIADPGGFLVQEAIKLGFEVIPIPGPSAIIAARSIGGFYDNGFVYIGYFPKKKGRQTLLLEINSANKTYIFYESPERITKTLNLMLEICGDKELVVCRELTKKFETVYRGKISEILKLVKPKGEFVVIIKPDDKNHSL